MASTLAATPGLAGREPGEVDQGLVPERRFQGHLAPGDEFFQGRAELGVRQGHLEELPHAGSQLGLPEQGVSVARGLAQGVQQPRPDPFGPGRRESQP
jgi:hypothetical protein